MKRLPIDILLVALWLTFSITSTVRGQDPAEWFFNRGAELQKVGKVSQALRLYEKAIEKNSRHHRALYAAGVASFQLGDYDRAEQLLKRLTALYPDDVRAQLYLARIALNTGEFEHAKIGFLKYLVKHPADTVALIGLGRAEYLSGNCEAGSQYFDQALASKPGDGKVAATVRRYREECARTCEQVRKRLQYRGHKARVTDRG